MNDHDPVNFTISLHKNIETIKEQLHHTAELVVRTIRIGESKYNVALIYLDELVNADVIRDFIITPLFLFKGMKKSDTRPFIDHLASEHIRASSVEMVSSFEDALNGIVRGRTLILVEGYDGGIIAETTQWQQRSVEQSSRQRSPGGPMIGLSEQLKVNLNLIRSFIKSPDLVVEMKQIGRFAKTDLSIVYLNHKVDKQALEKVRTRIETLDVEYVLESRVVEDALEGRKKTIFPLIFNSEMPDIVAAALYEGRIAILVDGTPQASIVPALFVQFMAQPIEYYSKTGKLSNRLILFFSYFISVFIPGIYIAVANFHKDWIPAKYAKRFFKESETLLPLFLEVFLLLLILYILGLASFRIQTDLIVLASLVGTMVISTTLVDAKLVHPFSMIIVGISFLTNFLFLTGGMASAALSLRILFLIIGSFFGLTAMGIGLILLIFYMALLRSVGVPYLAPIIPFRPQEFKDVFYRGDTKKLINSEHKYPHDDTE
ncbi:spore germination protein [Bacillus sp. AFS017336]|uniref:spore germination protein n=1 Tax=Bacillus sp. AFS017336 TaxID=2033489 RepID=UPI000BF1E846|nr:spore germination protein [Bacillus sp. AFS017336]PEK98050.1 spore gernimation protein GerA [Bacillus sp. AFS017336]